MTTTLPVRYRDHTVIGTPDQLANLIVNHTTAGTLAGISAPQPRQDGRFAVVLRLRDTTPELSHPRQRHPVPTVRARTAAGPPARAAIPHPARVSAYPAEVAYPLSARIRSPRTRGRHRIGLAVTAIVVVVAVLVFAAGWLLNRIASIAIDGPTLLGLLGVALLITAALRGSNGRRRHCPGCH